MLVSFRPCGPKDFKTLLKLTTAYYRHDKIPYDLASLQTWLMEAHHKPVGYALLTYNFDLEYGGVEGMLTDLYVEKRYRHHGVGSLALYELEDFCRERGIRAIELQVLNHNKAAETFYRKAGFRVLPRKVMVFDVRPEEQPRPRVATTLNKRR